MPSNFHMLYWCIFDPLDIFYFKMNMIIFRYNVESHFDKMSEKFHISLICDFEMFIILFESDITIIFVIKVLTHSQTR